MTPPSPKTGSIRVSDLLEPQQGGRRVMQGWSPQCERHPSASNDTWAVLKTTAVQDGQFEFQYNKALPAALAPKPELEVQAGDVLVTCAGPRDRCGVACLVRTTRPRLMISGKMYRLRARPGVVEPRYLEAALRSPGAQRQLDAMKTGTSESGMNLTHSRFAGLTIPFVDYPLQVRIADRLDACFARTRRAKAALDDVPALVDRLRQSILAAAFRGDLTADWREANPDVEPASELLRRIRIERRRRWEEAELAKMVAKGKPPKDDRWKAKYSEPRRADPEGLPDLPRGWCWASVDEISTRVVDGVHHTPEYVTHGVPFVTVRNLTAGPGIDLSNTQFISAADHEQLLKRANPELGDVLISKDGTIGVARHIESEPTYSIFVSVALVKPVLPTFGRFLSWAINEPGYQGRIVRTGSGLQHLHLGDLRSSCIPLAPLKEQERLVTSIENQLQRVQQLAHYHRGARASLETLNREILQVAFKGR